LRLIVLEIFYIFPLCVEDSRRLPKTSAPNVVIRGAYDRTVSEDALLGAFYKTVLNLTLILLLITAYISVAASALSAQIDVCLTDVHLRRCYSTRKAASALTGCHYAMLDFAIHKLINLDDAFPLPVRSHF
jgi:hypothetical protein